MKKAILSGAGFILALLFITRVFSGDYQRERNEMVETRIASRGVKNERVLKAMRDVPRHLFVPPEYRKLAYEDYPLSIGHSQTISQPYIVAFMTEAADLKPADKVLEIGTGSGYQTAILSKLVDKVYSVEIIEPLARNAEERLDRLGYKNIFIKCADGYKGWPEHAPYDAIIVTAAPEEIPGTLVDQLKDGGVMIVPVGSYYQELYRVIKKGGVLHKEVLMPVRFVPMIRGVDVAIGPP
ncbi:MAG: protein-L-isoaspartate(D-aspartate) O-methyltransferase [Candidatus Aureabacteria bacterium]|nr:protein-L-isoaspartate(D-aspartate) O-methyltransferase [Candidatus Auribacterota bacterium]